MSTVSVLFLALLLWIGWRYLTRGRAAEAWLPSELRRAELAYSEQLFKTWDPFPLAAKIDRAYRAGSKLVLVELKTRAMDRVYRSDVIELSAQRVAILGDTGEAVAGYGYVVVENPHSGKRWSKRVGLLPAEALEALAERHRQLGKSVAPRGAKCAGLCTNCPFARTCNVRVH